MSLSKVSVQIRSYGAHCFTHSTKSGQIKLDNSKGMSHTIVITLQDKSILIMLIYYSVQNIGYTFGIKKRADEIAVLFNSGKV